MLCCAKYRRCESSRVTSPWDMCTTVHPSIYRNLQVATGHATKLLLTTGKINLVMAHGFRFGNYWLWNHSSRNNKYAISVRFEKMSGWLNATSTRIRILLKPHTFYTITGNPITKTALLWNRSSVPFKTPSTRRCPDSCGNGLSSSKSRVPESGPWRKALLLRWSWRRPGIRTLATQPPGINFIKRFKCSFCFQTLKQ